MFTKVPKLEAAINGYVAHHNIDPKPFVHTKSARDRLHRPTRTNARPSSEENETPHEPANMNSPVPGNWVGLAWVASHPIAYPALEVLHITGIALLLGSLVLLDLRVWGLAAELPLRPLARLSLSVTLAGFGLLVCSGLMMFATQPAELLANRAFLLKLGLVQLAGLNALWFHARQSLLRCDGLARVQTVLSTGLWLGAIICGRWIAYL